MALPGGSLDKQPAECLALGQLWSKINESDQSGLGQCPPFLSRTDPAGSEIRQGQTRDLWITPGSMGSHEGLVEVSPDVGRMFETHRDPDRAFADTCLLERSRIQLPM